MSEYDDEGAYNLLLDNFTNIEVILKPNLSEYNLKILSFLLSAIKGQLKTFLELKSKDKKISVLQIINKNTSKLSQNIADLMNIIKNKKFSFVSTQKINEFSIMSEPSNFNFKSYNSLNAGQYKGMIRNHNKDRSYYSTCQTMDMIYDKKSYNDEIYQRNFRNKESKKLSYHTQHKKNNHPKHYMINTECSTNNAINENRKVYNNSKKNNDYISAYIPSSKMRSSRSLVVNKHYNNDNINKDINTKLKNNKNSSKFIISSSDRLNEKSIDNIKSNNIENSKYNTIIVNNKKRYAKKELKTPCSTNKINYNQNFGFHSCSHKKLEENDNIMLCNKVSRGANRNTTIKPSIAAQNLIKKFHYIVEQFNKDNSFDSYDNKNKKINVRSHSVVQNNN